MDISININNVDFIQQSLLATWHDEWTQLHPRKQWIVAQDFYDAHCNEGIGAIEYRDRIYIGNLDAYAKTL